MRDGKWKFIIFLVLAILLSVVIKKADNLLINNYGQREVLLNAVIKFMAYVFFGILFGIDTLIIEKRKNGKWSVRISRILILGIPSLVISLYGIIYYYMPISFSFLPTLYNLVFLNYTALSILMEIVFGYTLVTSFYRKENL